MKKKYTFNDPTLGKFAYLQQQNNISCNSLENYIHEILQNGGNECNQGSMDGCLDLYIYS